MTPDRTHPGRNGDGPNAEDLKRALAALQPETVDVDAGWQEHLRRAGEPRKSGHSITEPRALPGLGLARVVTFAAVIVALAVVAVVGSLAIGHPSGSSRPEHHSTSSTAPPPTKGGRIPVTMPSADVVVLQMFTPSSGVAVGSTSATHGPEYLLGTSDGGDTWQVTGVLPAYAIPHQLVGFEMTLAFTGPGEGYFEDDSGIPSITIFTDDAGRTWSRVVTHGQPSAMSLAGSGLWIVSNFCPDQTSISGCSSRLLTYKFGGLAPTAELPVPIMGVTPSKLGGDDETTLIERLGPHSAVLEEGQLSPTSLVITSDDGESWHALDNPCGGLIPSGLVNSSSTNWSLFCELDGGMNQGTTALYTSTDAGQNWVLRAEANEEDGAVIGSIGDGMREDMTLSGNGQFIWTIGQVYGVEFSRDGGRDWTTAAIQTGGDFSNLASAGSSDAWLPVPWNGLYRTTNGTTWAKLP